ncbi:arp2/3 complex subunit [Dispira simplex]|nr:arp2/3 complex subunit [Dispira simplex]
MAHRQIDVDILNSDRYIDEFEALTTQTPEEVEAQVQNKASTVRSALTRGNVQEALHLALENPPFGNRFASAQHLNGQLVMDVLASTKTSDILTTVQALSQDEVDVLTKYIYHGLAHPATYNCGILLSWHEKVTEVGGLGTLVRMLTDNKALNA